MTTLVTVVDVPVTYGTGVQLDAVGGQDQQTIGGNPHMLPPDQMVADLNKDCSILRLEIPIIFPKNSTRGYRKLMICQAHM